jgi:hypothetical protein
MKLPSIGRFTAGVLAALVAVPLTCLAAVAEVRILKRLHWQALVAVFLGITGGVLWLGEEYGLIADPYRDSKDDPLSLK